MIHVNNLHIFIFITVVSFKFTYVQLYLYILLDVVWFDRRCAKAALDDVILWLKCGGEVAVSSLSYSFMLTRC